MRSPFACVVAFGLVGLTLGPAAADSTVVGICTPVPPTARVTVEVKPAVSVNDLAAWIAGVTCEAVIIAPDVAKHATRLQVIVPGPITVAEARRLFVQTMEAAGLRVAYRRRTYTVSLGPGMPRGCPDVAGDEEAPNSGGARPIDATVKAARLAATITRIDATHVAVPRATVDQLLADPSAFALGARVLPATKGDQMIGFRLYGLRPAGIPARLGLANGDTVTAVDGQPLTTLDQALEAYASLRDAKVSELSVTRRGRPVTLTITIVP